MITQERLKELLHYNPDTGVFKWMVRRPRGVEIGSIAGTRSHGYINIGADGNMYLAHRLAVFYMNGTWPEEVDHEDHVRDNNRWVNLRPVTRFENQKNRPRVANNTSGITGVSKDKRTNKWQSYIASNKKNIYLGQFHDFFEACCARKSAEVKYGFHENHGARR